MTDSNNIFNTFKTNIANIDPIYFIENNLVLEGEQFKLNGNGYKPFVEIYRHIGVSALKEDSKPIILVKGRQVGATTMASALELYFMASGLFGTAGRSPMRIIHAFPTLIHVFTYAKTKLNPLIRSANPHPELVRGKRISCIEAKLDKSSESSDSLQYKQFDGGNFLRIESTGLDADRLRGGTVDAILYDEVQDTPKLAIQNANKLLTAAKYGSRRGGLQVYFGTPKQRSSHYYEMWSRSSQQYYYLGCEKCEEHFPLYTPGSDEWEKIWLYEYIVKCPHCNHMQDKREAAERGKWVATKPIDECEMTGYHINQMYNPKMKREDMEYEKPENHPINTERAWKNEVLGEFFSGEMGPMSPEQIEDKCADRGRKMSSGISSKEGKKVFIGFDWGKKSDADAVGSAEAKKSGGQSYSTCVVLVEDGHQLKIEFATIIKKSDFNYLKDFVDEMIRKYSATQVVGDIGYAHHLFEEMQHKHGDLFLASRLVSKVNGYTRFNDQTFPKEIQAEREHYIEELYNVMKRGMIRFPWGDWEKISWLIKHCCSMEIKTTLNSVHEPVRRYIKGDGPNDGFMALLNAYIAYKHHATGGFSDNKGGLSDPNSGKKKVMAITGYCPNF